MADGARVDSIDALKHFRVALLKFQEAANVAMGDCEADLHSTMNWLEHEQFTYWQGQIRKRHDIVERAKEAVRMKKLFRDSSGRIPSAVEEEKALLIAKRRFEEAEQKLVNVKKYTRILQKEIESYKGSVQRLATSVQSDIPLAAASIAGMVDQLERYVGLIAPDAAVSGLSAESSAAAPNLQASGDTDQ